MYIGHFDFGVPLLDTVDDVLSTDECEAVLAGLAGAEWLAATVNKASGRAVDARLRDNDLAIVRDEALAERVYDRIVRHLPARMSAEWGDGRRGVEPAGLFLPLRVYRYRPGQRFGLHQDQSYARDDGARSLLTLLVYLDDDCDGGETDFPEQGQRIAPRRGAALWFQHMLLHAGLPVTRGLKHVLRSDVLYRPAP